MSDITNMFNRVGLIMDAKKMQESASSSTREEFDIGKSNKYDDILGNKSVGDGLGMFTPLQKMAEYYNGDKKKKPVQSRPDKFEYKERPSMSESVGLVELDPRKNKKDDVPWGTIGLGTAATIGTLGLANAVARNNPASPFKVMKDNAYDFAKKQPKNMARRAGFKNEYDFAARAKKNFKKGNSYKRAMELDEFNNLCKVAMDTNKAKQIFKEDFLKAGVTAIPYAVTPMAIGMAYNKATHKPKERDIVIEVSKDDYDKINTEKLSSENFFKEEMPKHFVRAAGKTIIPAATIAGGKFAYDKLSKKDKEETPIRIKMSLSDLEKIAAGVVQDAADRKGDKFDDIISAMDKADYLQSEIDKVKEARKTVSSKPMTNGKQQLRQMNNMR